jgi:fructose-specific component phosphotransferase system IIB-like protein
MALVLSKTGITTSNTVEAWHVTQSIDALTGAAAYNISISGSLSITGSVVSTQGMSGSFTGSFGGNLNGTALLATSASYALTSSFGSTSISASYALTSSFGSTSISASYAQTASYVLNAVSASFATSASTAISSSFATTASFARVFPFTGSAVILGSLEVSSTSLINGITIGSKNVSSTRLGNAALISLTTGDGNTGVGYQAGFNLQGGGGNTVIGDSALLQASSADNNTAIGFYSLYNITTGAGNTAVGTNSGYNNNTGNYNVYIGNEVLGVAGESNKLKIHSSASNTTSPLILGDFSTRDLTINGDLTVSGSQVLTLVPTHPLPTGIATGSFAVSASAPPRPYMWDGSSWYAL